MLNSQLNVSHFTRCLIVVESNVQYRWQRENDLNTGCYDTETTKQPFAANNEATSDETDD